MGIFRSFFTYVFAGLVTCQNHPCSNARVDLNLDSVAEGVITQTTRASEDGRYQIEVLCRGLRMASAWKLELIRSVSSRHQAKPKDASFFKRAKAPIVVDRSLLLVQA